MNLPNVKVENVAVLLDERDLPMESLNELEEQAVGLQNYAVTCSKDVGDSPTANDLSARIISTFSLVSRNSEVLKPITGVDRYAEVQATSKVPVTCTVCSRIFPDKYKLRKHRQLSQCSSFNRLRSGATTTVSKNSLKSAYTILIDKHDKCKIRSNSSKEAQRLLERTCSICNKTFSTKCSLKRHHRKVCSRLKLQLTLKASQKKPRNNESKSSPDNEVVIEALDEFVPLKPKRVKTAKPQPLPISNNDEFHDTVLTQDPLADDDVFASDSLVPAAVAPTTQEIVVPSLAPGPSKIKLSVTLPTPINFLSPMNNKTMPALTTFLSEPLQRHKNHGNSLTLKTAGLKEQTEDSLFKEKEIPQREADPREEFLKNIYFTSFSSVKRIQEPSFDNFSCKICTRIFKSWILLERHIADEHGVSIPTTQLHRCTICPRSFDYSGRLHWHYENAHFDTCPICHKTFDGGKSEVRSHVLLKICSPPQPHQPHLQSGESVPEIGPEVHNSAPQQQQQGTSEKNNIFCSLCKEKVGTFEALKQHIISAHPGKKLFIINGGSGGGLLNQSKAVIPNLTNQVKIVFRCSKCLMLFKDGESLQQHKQQDSCSTLLT